MLCSAEAYPLALCAYTDKKTSDDRPPFLENPRLEGAESTLTENAASPFQAEPRQFVSTSHVERLNLSVRTHLRRFVRRTNGHSRKLANHKACVSLWIAWYNFVRVNTAIRMTPCMAAGITGTIWTMRDLLTSNQEGVAA